MYLMNRVNLVSKTRKRLLCATQCVAESQQVNRRSVHSLADVLSRQDQAAGLTPEAADVPLFL